MKQIAKAKVQVETEERRKVAEDNLWEAAKNWPSDFFTRESGVIFSGGSLSVGHLANLDSRGEGPEDAFYQGRKRTYTKKRFVEFLIRRLGV